MWVEWKLKWRFFHGCKEAHLKELTERVENHEATPEVHNFILLPWNGNKIAANKYKHLSDKVVESGKCFNEILIKS